MAVVDMFSREPFKDEENQSTLDSLFDEERDKYSKVIVLGFTPEGNIRGVIGGNFSGPEALWVLEHFKQSLLDGG